MAGTHPPYFSAADFREKIRFCWTMASPSISYEAVTWHFAPTGVPAGQVDGDGVPFDPTVTIPTAEPTPVRIECGVEYIDHNAEPVPFGSVVPATLRLTVFDEDWPTVKDSTYVMVNGCKYKRSHEYAPYALFDVTLHELHLEATDVV